MSDASTILMVLCAVIVTGIAVSTRIRPRSPATVAEREVENLERISKLSTPLLGHGEPPTVIVISDYQCPFCRVADSTLVELAARLGPRMSIKVLHLPLPELHPAAEALAAAAECASRIGKFADFHATAFRYQDELETTSPEVIAIRAGISDTVSLSKCRRDSEVLERVDAHRQTATSLDVRGTPAFIINGRLSVGLVPADLVRKVERAAR